MDWHDETREGLEMALNESDVVGIRLDPSERYVDVLLHVLSLPVSGPLPKDGRRVLRLTAPSELRFLLRTGPVGEQPSDHPAVPLPDLTAVERFFDSLAWGGSIYGWRFFDDSELTSDWPVKPSLTVQLRDTPALHSFYWFNECGVEQGVETTSYCIEGTIAFDDLLVLDASGNEISTETFIADGVRHWEALYVHDARLSTGAQRAAQQGAPKWREWATGGRSAIGTL